MGPTHPTSSIASLLRTHGLISTRRHAAPKITRLTPYIKRFDCHTSLPSWTLWSLLSKALRRLFPHSSDHPPGGRTMHRNNPVRSDSCSLQTSDDIVLCTCSNLLIPCVHRRGATVGAHSQNYPPMAPSPNGSRSRLCAFPSATNSTCSEPTPPHVALCAPGPNLFHPIQHIDAVR